MVRSIGESFRPFGGSAEGRFIERENNFLAPENPQNGAEFWKALQQRFRLDVFFSRFVFVISLNVAGDLFGALGHRFARRVGIRSQLLAPILFDEAGTAVLTARNREGGLNFSNYGLDLFEAIIQRSIMHPALKLLPEIDLTKLSRRGRIGWKASNILLMGGVILAGSIMARVASHIAFSQKDNPLAKTRYGLALEAVDMVLAAGQSRVRHAVPRAIAARAAKTPSVPAVTAASAVPATSAAPAATAAVVSATATAATPAASGHVVRVPIAQQTADELHRTMQSVDERTRRAAYDRLHFLAQGDNAAESYQVLREFAPLDPLAIFVLMDLGSHKQAQACTVLANVAINYGAPQQGRALQALRDLARSDFNNSPAVAALGEVAKTEVVGTIALVELAYRGNSHASSKLSEVDIDRVERMAISNDDALMAMGMLLHLGDLQARSYFTRRFDYERLMRVLSNRAATDVDAQTLLDRLTLLEQLEGGMS